MGVATQFDWIGYDPHNEYSNGCANAVDNILSQLFHELLITTCPDY
jgi:hypothetical protein